MYELCFNFSILIYEKPLFEVKFLFQQMQILDVCCRWPGSAHDATIFANSSLYQRLQLNEFGNSAVLGDSAYGPDVFTCKPLPNAVSESEKAYQYAQIRSRNVAERTYGALKKKFPCLSLGMSYKREKIQDVIFACCILYNFVRKHSPQDFIDDMIDGDMNIERPIEREEIDIQNEICNQLEIAQQAQPMSIQQFLLDNYF